MALILYELEMRGGKTGGGGGQENCADSLVSSVFVALFFSLPPHSLSSHISPSHTEAMHHKFT